MGKAYQSIFWGIMFVIININIGPIDIMPNIIGYLLIVNGLTKLYGMTNIKAFYTANIVSGILAIYSIFIFLWKFGGGLENDSILGIVMGTIVQLVQLIMVFYIYEGTLELLEHENHNLLSMMKGGQKFFVYTFLITSFVVPFSLNVDESFSAFIIIVGGIANVCAVISWAVNMSRVKRYYFEKEY